MTTQLDSQIGIKKESTYGTAVTVDSFLEFTDESLDWSPTQVQGAGMRVGQIADYADRRRIGREEVGGSITVETLTKGMGKLIEAAMGADGQSNVVTGAAYQQLFTPATSDPINSYTIQKGIPLRDGGAAQPMTFAGMVCSGFELTIPNGGLPTLTTNWVGKSVATGTALATASYATSVDQLSFVDGSITIGGSVTVPTTTALASGGTAVANIRSARITYDNGLDTEGFNLGGAGKRSRKPNLGKRSITGNIEAEFDAATLRDAWLNSTSLALVLTLQFPVAITGSTYPTLQVTIPVIRLEGELPKATQPGSVVTQSIDFTGLDGRVASAPIYVAIVTTETAI